MRGRTPHNKGKRMSEDQKDKLRQSYWKRRHAAKAAGKNHLLIGYEIVSLKDTAYTQIDECGCGRRYLLKLGCLWCNKYNLYGTKENNHTNDESNGSVSKRGQDHSKAFS